LRTSGVAWPNGQGITYAPLGDILRSHLGFEADAGPDRILAGLAGREILGLTLGLDTGHGRNPRDARDLLHAAWLSLVDEIVAIGPAVFVVEDLHWAPPPLLELMADLVTGVAGPLLVVATARPEYAEAHPAPVGTPNQQQALWLDPLTDEQSEAMLTNLLGQRPDDRLRRAVLGPAEGNPFFIEELLATLIDRGLLGPSADGWRLADDATATPVPDTIRAALATRIDCLGPDARATLQAASVAGRTFTAAALGRIIEPLRPQLGELVERDLIRRQPSAQPTYSFKHALIRQVAYDLLPAARRAGLHAAFADALADSADLDERASLLAHHYAEAARTDLADVAWADDPAALTRLRELAVTWLRRAAELAEHRYAVDEAIALLQQALDLAPPPITQAAIWRAIADAHLICGDYTTFQTAILRAVQVCDDPYQQAEAYASMAAAVTDAGVIMSALPSAGVVEGWLERALALAPAGTGAHTLALSIQAAWFPEHLATLAPQALAAAEHGDNLYHRIEAYAVQGSLARRQRRISDALDWRLRLIQLTESAGLAVGDEYLQPIPALMQLGRFAEARDYAARNETIAV